MLYVERVLCATIADPSISASCCLFHARLWLTPSGSDSGGPRPAIRGPGRDHSRAHGVGQDAGLPPPAHYRHRPGQWCRPGVCANPDYLYMYIFLFLVLFVETYRRPPAYGALFHCFIVFLCFCLCACYLFPRISATNLDRDTVQVCMQTPNIVC